tara:strand:+ start:405 stop:1121 length:717 start_codon:yes stop_codon:yes gene_type:complete
MASLSLYGLGRSTGMVVEIGHGVTHVVPVIQGYSIPQGIMRLDIGGRIITDRLKTLLTQSGYNFTTSAEHEVLEHVKFQLGYVSMDPSGEENNFPIEKVREYEMPDGQKIKVGSEAFQCTEVLFRPSLMGKEWPGLHDLIAQSIEKCDITVRRELWETIILGGGSSVFPGLDQRLFKELSQLVPSEVSVNIIAPPTRVFSTWLGGAALAANPAFQNQWITRERWQREGPSCVHDNQYQ